MAIGLMGALAVGSFGLSAFNTLFAPDPNEENARIAEQNRQLIQQRMDRIQGVFGRRGEFFDEETGRLQPKLAFADTQGRQAATAGAKAAQASVRRSLGSGGGVFSAALEAGSRTAATDRQNTLRAMAIGEANRAVTNRIGQEVGAIAGQPIGFNPAFVPGRAQQNASLFANVGTSLAQQNFLNQQNQTGQQPAQQQGQGFGPIDLSRQNANLQFGPGPLFFS